MSDTCSDTCRFPGFGQDSFSKKPGWQRRKKNESDGPLVHSFLGVFAAEILLTESRVRILAGDDDYSAL